MKRVPAVTFDAEYYQRFYISPKTRVYSQAKHAQLVAGVIHLSEWFAGPIQTVIDMGAGVGWWRDWLRQNRPHIKYRSFEYQQDTCARFGHQQADIVTFSVDTPAQLTICQGVLPYLTAKKASLAIECLASATSQLLYLEAITAEDAAFHVDTTLTDLRIHLHKASWYRKSLSRFFRPVGAGLWAKHDAALTFYSLEAATR